MAHSRGTSYSSLTSRGSLCSIHCGGAVRIASGSHARSDSCSGFGARSRQGHKEKRRNDTAKGGFMVFSPPSLFSASFFSLLLLFCLRLTRLPLLAPLHSSRRVLGWELISAVVWARDGSEDGEGAGDVEMDLWTGYGCGCMCVCVCGFASKRKHTLPFSWL